MSNSGFFPKVVNPNKVLYQMKSETFQKPHYFGGSQVPINLRHSYLEYSGRGMKSSKIQPNDMGKKTGKISTENDKRNNFEDIYHNVFPIGNNKIIPRNPPSEAYKLSKKRAKYSYEGRGFVGDKPPKNLGGYRILKQDIK